MARALMAELVTASMGHMPRTWMKIGFSSQMPLMNSS